MPTPPDQLLREFKGDLRASLPLHPLEKATIWAVSITLCALPWMLGSMRVWAQLIGFGLALVAFALALIPRHFVGDYTHNQAFTYYPWKKLIRWPFFWIGILFFTYVLIQALNPAWEYVTHPERGTWSMRKIEHIDWLPTGMTTPFATMNTWRQMMIWTLPFFVGCAIWIGFTRRKSLIALLTVVVGNATVLALVGIVARYTAPAKILWLVDGIRNYCFSSFVYKNHAGSFFALSVGLTLALAVFVHQRAARHQRRSSPASLLVFVAMIQLVAVLLTYSRAAILIVGAFLVVLTLFGFIRLLLRGGFNRAPIAIVGFLLGLTVFGVVGSKLVESEKTLDRISQLTNSEKADYSVLRRRLAWVAGWDMASENAMTGWGAGGFRFLFPRYQQTEPKITWRYHNKKRGYIFWEHAHNDYLQTLIEVGRVGLGLLLVGFATMVLSFFRNRGIHHLTGLSLFAAAGITLAHAAVDFPLQNPAILTLLAAVLVLPLSLTTLERRPTRA
ncbi:O-antigen ligase family protein [Actomonas aquatica]|uniref:O-antigen ligase family protein n=1 Tax=Actomonas aquatica TaxID=2866162 RepID=A0ABZ1CAF2_9BACT|nr:O-antigen ligase family protein [Opitutus sp. WL0086]WRQ88579.1 O-antigen ligase family protein [Opitutus sp. WL0086]